MQFVEARSTDAVWLFDDTSVWVTNGTPAGTRAVVPSHGLAPPFEFVLETNHRVGGYVGGQFIIWGEDGVQQSARPDIFTVSTTANGFIFGGTDLSAETGPPLARGACMALRGGGWANCRQSTSFVGAIFSTDGTVAGTMPRDQVDSFIDPVYADAQWLVYQSDVGFTVLERSGPPRRLSTACLATDRRTRVQNGILVCFDALVPLDGGPFTPVEGVHRAISRNGAELFLETQGGGLELTDGVPDGGRRQLRDRAITEPSFPSVLTSDGVTALYATATAGTWLTDGTTEGTVRVGDDGLRWGSGALGRTDAGIRGFDDHAREVPLPAGVVGASGAWALGIDGCSVFRVDAEGKRATLRTPRCPRRVVPFDDAALLVLDDGRAMLIHPPNEPLALGSDVDVEGGTRCGKELCWIRSRPDAAGNVEFRTVNAAKKTITVEDVVPAEAPVELLAATDGLLITLARDTGAVRIKPRGQLATLDKTRLDLVVLLASSKTETVVAFDRTFLRFGADGSSSGEQLDCEVAALAATDDTVWVATETCSVSKARLLGFHGKTTTEVNLDGQVVTELRAEPAQVFFVTNAGLRAADDTGAQVELTSKGRPGNVGRVRAGLVFAATDDAQDTELWVVRFARPAAACGCSNAEATLALVALVLLLLRNSRARAGRPAPTRR
jgi:hypothetical protein